MNIFRPPAAARAAKILDRSVFHRSLPTAAASINDPRLISKYRKSLEKTKELLLLPAFDTVQIDPDPLKAKKGGKCILLQPKIQAQGQYRRHGNFSSSILGD